MKHTYLIFFILVITFLFSKCTPNQKPYLIAASVEEPQYEITKVLTTIVNEVTDDSIVVSQEVYETVAIDSLESGYVDFAIVDNFSDLSDNIRTIIPLYSSILHILHKRDVEYSSLATLLSSKKIYAGRNGSNTFRFVSKLMQHYGINPRKIDFLSDFEIFDAEVIFSFTDLLSNQELKDLSDYKLFSLDRVDNYMRGSLAEGICTIYPEFSPYILAKDVYGDYTQTPILTLQSHVLLVGRQDLSKELVFNIVKSLDDHKKRINNINPLLYNFPGVFTNYNLSFKLHDGTRNYINRHEPGFLEKYAEVLSVIISIVVALFSAGFSLSSWQKTRKKNKIDVYYQKILDIRKLTEKNHINSDKVQLKKLLDTVKDIQSETFGLVIDERLMADDTFIIFLNLSKMVIYEIEKKLTYQNGT